MNHEAREAAQAGVADVGDRQVGLTPAGGRAGSDPARPSEPRFRLKRSVELVEDGDCIYLLRLGAGDDLVLRDPSTGERLILQRLAAGYAGRDELWRLMPSRDAAGADHCLEQLLHAGLVEGSEQRSALPRQLAERLDRQLIYLSDLAGPDQSAGELQLRLSQATVALLGVGGLGAWVAAALSGAGVGRLIVIDDDRIELSNLNRQILYREDQLGQLKVDAAAASLRAHNAHLAVEKVCQRIRGPEDLGDVMAVGPDLVVATADWPPHDLPRWVNEACLGAGVPWIGAGQFPPRLRVGPMTVPGASSCFVCHEEMVRAEHPLYDLVAAHRGQRETPDSSIGAVSGVIGSLLAMEVIHFLLGAFEPASVGAAIVVDLQTLRFSRTPVPKRDDCPACGRSSPVRTKKDHR